MLQGSIVPVLGLIAKAATSSGSRQLARKARLHAELLKEVPDDLAGPLRLLLEAEVEALSLAERRRLDRSVDAGTVVAIVLIAVAGGASLVFALRFGEWWSTLLGFAGALFCALLIAVGVGQIFKYPDLDPPPPG